ncbi:acyltransferase [Micrococcus porci]|uniref:acyltransferase family protein n=1 Tax=Micrococcus porci TaxID=2856555 RepID=UPI001CCD7521|nr:acyltransferase [Micrococcus porci]UBH24492.1 acyltransferase [Micrococcus porci]
MTAASSNEPGAATVPPIEKRHPGPRFRELDGLRGIAALAVVLYHFTGHFAARFPAAPRAFHDFWWGEYGVQLFFLLSGFVILMTAWRAKRPSDFAISRVARLYPPYWISLAVAVSLLLWRPMPGFPIDPATVVANVTMVQRWFLFPNVVEVYWTLAVEMQFYVIVFVLLLVTRCRLRGRVLLWAAAAWTAVSWVVILAAFRVTSDNPQADPTWVKLLTNATVAEYGPLFVTGMLFYLVRETGRHPGWAIASAASTALGATLLRGSEHGVMVAAVCALAWLVWRVGEQWLGKHARTGLVSLRDHVSPRAVASKREAAR